MRSRVRMSLVSRGAAAALALVTVVARPAAGFESDIHLHATYLLARAAGMGSDQALAIARADLGADSSEAGLLSNSYPALRGLATALSFLTVVWPAVFAIFGDYDDACDWVGKLSDFVVPATSAPVHFPLATNSDRVVAYTGQAGHETRELLAFAREAWDDAVLGIALHSLGDSWSHQGLLPNSHFGNDDWTDNLSTPSSRNRARGGLRETFRELSAWSRGRFLHRPLPSGEVESRIESWLAAVASEGSPGAARRTELLYDAFPEYAERASPGLSADFVRAVERVAEFLEESTPRGDS
ncbi:MAG: hypothetical protein HY720_31030 [Planctomycetes bacterium]|nr:hypothetical protein [Planctomycetota bacterium]